MRTEQKAIIWIGIAFLLAAGLYPPWLAVWGPGAKRAAGYHLLFAPSADESLEVDGLRLAIEWILIVTVAAALVWLPPSRPVWEWILAHFIRWIWSHCILPASVVGFFLALIAWQKPQIKQQLDHFFGTGDWPFVPTVICVAYFGVDAYLSMVAAIRSVLRAVYSLMVASIRWVLRALKPNRKVWYEMWLLRGDSVAQIAEEPKQDDQGTAELRAQAIANEEGIVVVLMECTKGVAVPKEVGEFKPG